MMAYMLLSIGCLPIGTGTEERGIGDREREGGREGWRREEKDKKAI